MTDPIEWFNSRGIDPDVARKAGVRYDPNKDALLYPRIGLDHMPLGWKVRQLSGNRQYNIPKGIPLRDTEPFTVRQGDGVLCICEGETDALMLGSWWEWLPLEDPHIIGIPGVTSFSNEWAGHYARFDDVLVFPDPDEAGERMVQKVCGLISRAKVVRLDSSVGDLGDALKNTLSDVAEMIESAEHVEITAPLRRTSYAYASDPDVPKHKLIDAVLLHTRLKRRGKEYMGLCPLHDEDTPSFMVDPKKGLFYCHGCRKGGDIISYFRHKEGITYAEAKRKAQSM
jgi:hypothetical protein